MDVKNYLSSGAETAYFEALKLNDIESKQDPETEPYRSAYKAREIWNKLKSEIDHHREETSSLNWNYLDAVLDLKLGANYAATEEKSSGEELLTRCIATLTEHHLEAEVCCVLISAHNQLAILYCDRGDTEISLASLNKAEKLYKEFKEEVGSTPWSVDDVFRADCYGPVAELEKFVLKRVENFEETHTLTLFYLAQVYTKLEARQTAADYCRMTLCRQLESRKYQPIEWSMNAATLSQYYLCEEDFTIARHCLASAETVLKEGDHTTSFSTDESLDEESTRHLQAFADLYRCWAKYGLALLEHSKERLYRELDADGLDTHPPPAERQSEVEQDRRRKTERFFDLELTSIENRVTDKHVCVFSEARDVFKAVQSWLEAAAMFYKLDGHCSDHVEIIRDHSRLYHVLAFFEPDLDRQCRMHKRRADMLAELLKALNRQYYLLVCRQLMYELAETFSAMLDNKLANIELSKVPPNDHARAKINSLVERSIAQFQAYIDSLRGFDGKLPETFQDDDEKPALIAHFHMGRLFSKFMSFDVPTRLKNTKKSMDCYEFVVDYCKKNPKAIASVKSERELCEEMVCLLPAKMEKIRAFAI